MSATIQSRTTRPVTASWVSMHRAATVILAVVVAALVVLAATLLSSRDSVSVPAPSTPGPAVTSQDCGTVVAPIPC